MLSVRPKPRPALHATTDNQVNSLKNSRMFQTVFRLEDENKTSPYHTRRPHKKSRGGCTACKKRRLKCDESKPNCRRCESSGALCIYTSASKTSNQNRKVEFLAAAKPSNTGFSLSLAGMATQIDDLLSNGSSNGYSKTSNPTVMLALQHFINCSTDTVANPAIRAVMKSDMIQVAFTNTHVMYTILGVGMLHLNRVSPGDNTRRCAEAHFWQQAIQLYQSALQTGVNQKNIDALLSTCMLMGVTSLCPEKCSPTDSWVLSNKPGAMNWLCLQSGLRCILEVSKPYMEQCIWNSAFQKSHEEEKHIFDCEDQIGRDGLDLHLADLCGIDEFSTDLTNPYYAPLRMLTPLLKLERNMPNAAQCATFMGRLEHDFLALLRARDPPALVVIAHWMGLMCSLAEFQPWIEGRVRAECIAICIYLGGIKDPRVLRLLEYPALACGYVKV